MHHSQNNSRPSLQGKGKAAGGHAGASILASVDGKAGRQRATNKQAAALGTSGQRRIWAWALPLALVAVAVGGAVFWMQQPAALVASASSIPSADDRAANRSVEHVAFVDATDTASTSLEVQTGAQTGGHSIDSHQTPAPSTGQTQGAYIEDVSALASGASPFAALQAKTNAQAEIASPFQALNEAAPPLSGPRAVPAHVGKEAGKQSAGRVPAHPLSKPVGRVPTLTAVASVSPSASAAGPAAAVPVNTRSTSSAVLARVDSPRVEAESKRVALAMQSDAKGASATMASTSSAMAVSTPVRSPAELPAAANTVAALKPAVTTIAASAAQAAASAAVAEAPMALGAGDPLNSLLKAAGHAAAAATAQGVSRLTRAETSQPTAAAGQPITAASAQSAAADARKPTALEKSAVESRAAGRQADGGQVESAPAPSKKPNNKPEKAKTPDPDVTLMRALMRHLETTSK